MLSSKVITRRRVLGEVCLRPSLLHQSLLGIGCPTRLRSRHSNSLLSGFRTEIEHAEPSLAVLLARGVQRHLTKALSLGFTWNVEISGASSDAPRLGWDVLWSFLHHIVAV